MASVKLWLAPQMQYAREVLFSRLLINAIDPFTQCDLLTSPSVTLISHAVRINKKETEDGKE